MRLIPTEADKKKAKKEYDRQYRIRPERLERSIQLRRAWRKRNLEANNKYLREWGVNKRYGLGRVQLQQMLERQDYRCAICLKPEAQLSTKLSVDHSHATGKVRGLLCHRCNVGIGFFTDDAKLFEAAVVYLRSFS